jgi:hypothetical protein
LGKERKNSTETMTATHVTVRSLTWKIKEVGHKLNMDNFSSSPDLFDDCTQAVSTVVGLSDKIIKECQGDLTRH